MGQDISKKCRIPRKFPRRKRDIFSLGTSWNLGYQYPIFIRHTWTCLNYSERWTCAGIATTHWSFVSLNLPLTRKVWIVGLVYNFTCYTLVIIPFPKKISIPYQESKPTLKGEMWLFFLVKVPREYDPIDEKTVSMTSSKYLWWSGVSPLTVDFCKLPSQICINKMLGHSFKIFFQMEVYMTVIYHGRK